MLRGSFPVAVYLRTAQDYVPALTRADVVRAPAGVRAQALDADGSLVDDFRISTLGPVTAVRNAPSPAATPSLAIAEYVTARMAVATMSALPNATYRGSGTRAGWRARR